MSLHAQLMRDETTVRDLSDELDSEALSWFQVDLKTSALAEVAVPSVATGVHVALRRRTSTEAQWKPFLRDLGVPLAGDDTPVSESVLVVVQTGEHRPRTLIWCFGVASLAVPNKLVDERFGLIVAINKHVAGEDSHPWTLLPENARRRSVAGDPSQLVRQLGADVRDGYRHTVMARSPGPSPVEGLRFERVSDLLKSIRVVTHDPLMPDLQGGRGLKFSTYIGSWNDFIHLADYLTEIRDRNDYQAEWDWIDHIVPVSPRSEVERVLEGLFHLIEEHDDTPVDIVLPELEGHVGSSRLCFQMGRNEVDRMPILWRSVRACLLALPRRPSTQLRQKIRIRTEGRQSEESVEYELIDLLAAEFDFEDGHLIVSDGEVLKVDRDFLERVDAALATIPWSDYPFPDWPGESERAYLEMVENTHSDEILMLDQRNIYLEDQTPFEPCDLLTTDKRLVFAKVKGRSSTFSHLCKQAELAAEMFVQHPLARDALYERIAEKNPNNRISDAATELLVSLEKREPRAVTVTLLLLGTWRARDLRTLPLLSRLCLRRTAYRLAGLGYKVEVASPDTNARRGER